MNLKDSRGHLEPAKPLMRLSTLLDVWHMVAYQTFYLCALVPENSRDFSPNTIRPKELRILRIGLFACTPLVVSVAATYGAHYQDV